MRSTLTFSATGDSFITRRLPSKADPSFQAVAAVIQQSEARFTNLETVIRRDEGFPFAVAGGTWASSDPSVLDALKAYGFNAINWATNHTLDYAYAGLEATHRYLDEAGLVHFGAGRNLAEASAPRYMECPSGRVAFLGATFSFQETWRAGAQRDNMVGRPGVNPVRVDRTFLVSAEQMKLLRQVAHQTGINDAQDISTREGFLPPAPQGSFRFGTAAAFKEAASAGQQVNVVKADRERMLTSIDEARRQADLVVVSLHCHDTIGSDKSVPPDYFVTFARACIDGGAHAVIGHGPHVLRGIEIYRDRPIFYSLGNFIFQSDTVTHLPSDFYEKHAIDPACNVADAIDHRSRNGTVGLCVNPDAWQSVIAQWTMTEGRLQSLALRPITLGFGLPRYAQGWPRLAAAPESEIVFEQVTRLCEPFGTSLVIDGETARVRL